jgi:protein-tyrosine phosphatase
VTVCRANVARSYFAERFLIAALEERGVSEADVAVSSRGTHVSPLVESAPDIDDILRSFGATPRQHTPAQLTRPDLQSADLILVAEGALEEALVDIFPGSSNITFTLVQFARLTTELDANVFARAPQSDKTGNHAITLRGRVTVLNRYRGYLVPGSESLDINDPAGQPRDVLAEAARTIQASTDAIANWCVTP